MSLKSFDRFALQYDEWFDKNRFIYESELQAIKELLPEYGNGLEVGVGSGRFAAPLNIKLGVDPSRDMGKIAQKRGIKVVKGVAESLPFTTSQFDLVLMVTTLCFLDNVKKAFEEVHRVLKPDGYFIIGFIDADSPLGKYYQHHKSESRFYNDAKFYPVKEVISYLKQTPFNDLQFRQTLFRPLSKIKHPEPVKEGFGEGSFVVIRGSKK